MKFSLGALLAALMAASGTCTKSAAAEAPPLAPTFDSTSIQYRPPETERRGGFVTALTIGYGLGEYHGYPLEVAALNDPSQKQSTGASLASNLSLWIGAAPRDWITFGFGLSFLGAALNQNFGTASAFLFHVEGFPLYSLGGIYRDLGLGFDGGAGASLLFDKDDKKLENPLAESGSLSTLGFNVFWEPIAFWKISMGPSLNYTHAFSQTMKVNQVTLGFRTVLYTSQPKLNSNKP